jgi:glycerol-3-phosphate dehydrogenase
MPIGGGRDFPQTAADERAWLAAHLPDAGERAGLLFARYGTRAAAVWEAVSDGDDAPLADGALSTGELAWMVEREFVTRLSDVVLRRTSIAFTGLRDATVLDEIAGALAPLLGWDEERRTAEVARTATLLAERHGVTLGAVEHRR